MQSSIKKQPRIALEQEKLKLKESSEKEQKNSYTKAKED
jgi:hypothetical protein